MNLLEKSIFAASYALEFHSKISQGYPQSWREADRSAGRPKGDAGRLADWERWCAGVARCHAEAAVELYRQTEAK